MPTQEMPTQEMPTQEMPSADRRGVRPVDAAGSEWYVVQLTDPAAVGRAEAQRVVREVNTALRAVCNPSAVPHVERRRGRYRLTFAESAGCYLPFGAELRLYVCARNGGAVRPHTPLADCYPAVVPAFDRGDNGTHICAFTSEGVAPRPATSPATSPDTPDPRETLHLLF